MFDYPDPRLSPCCDAEAWDLDCDTCGGDCQDEDGEDCKECDGVGFIDGWCECSKCGDTF